MFEEADNLADIFRGGLPYYLLITLPILIICSSNPVLASSEYSVQRMSQFDVHGAPFGCRASALNLEAKSLYTWSTSRHCVIARFQDLTIDQFREIRAKAGGLVLLLPQDLNTLSADDRQHILLLEQAMMAQEISIPVYFSTYDTSLEGIVNDVTANSNASPGQRDSALAEIMNSISANGYQIVVSGASHAANKQSKIPIIQGDLVPMSSVHKPSGDASRNTVDINPKLPLIIVTAHLDTFGLLNEHLGNLDVAVFLTLMDLFSKLHSTVSTAPKYRLLFLLSESGSLLNFQGMKKWLDTNVDDNVQIQNAEFVLCLDSIGLSDSSTIYMHVSKPPKDGTHMNNFYKHLKVAAQRFGNVSVEGVHKKINLAGDIIMAWEHERFSMKRMPAFTLSSLKSHKDPLRSTIFTDISPTGLDTLEIYTKIMAESLASYIYNLNEAEIFTGSMAVTKNSLKSWLNIKSTLQNNDLKNAFNKYLKNVKITYEKPDAREPDFMLYEGQEGLLNIYSVKPAVFDLFLTFLIAAYLSAIYCVIIYFPMLYAVICKWNCSKVKVN